MLNLRRAFGAMSCLLAMVLNFLVMQAMQPEQAAGSLPGSLLFSLVALPTVGLILCTGWGWRRDLGHMRARTLVLAHGVAAATAFCWVMLAVISLEVSTLPRLQASPFSGPGLILLVLPLYAMLNLLVFHRALQGRLLAHSRSN